MKPIFLCLGAALLFTSCASVRVVDTQTAAVVVKRPSAIYIKPFTIEGADFIGKHEGGAGELPIRKSLAPAEFGIALKEELELLAPARVLLPGEVPTQGWLVDGYFELVDGGGNAGRGVGMLPGLNPVGRTKIAIHVRVRDLDGETVSPDDKDASKNSRRGDVIYEFDVAGGSRLTGAFGSVRAPGWGYGATIDYRNAAERIRVALDPDNLRLGVRTTQSLR